MFFGKYPQFAGHDFYVSGESYGGHYVPNLAHKIVVENRKSYVGVTPINLKGFLVGNAWTDAAWDNRGAVEHWYSHALISKATHDGIMDKCDFSHIGPLYEDHDEECGQLVTQARTEMGNIDIYDIYEDLCLSSDNHMQRIPYAPWHLMSTETEPASPCINNWVSDYLNRMEVQEALHVDRTAVTKWDMCSAVVHYSDADLRSSMLDVYRDVFSESLRIMVYSGDVDGIVPVYGSRLWIDSLELPILDSWRHWMLDKMVAGYVQKYDKLTFATVRGAGHMVPGTQPDRALAMFTRFIQDQPM
jgi:serine carboxypeptidase-like clade 2